MIPCVESVGASVESQHKVQKLFQTPWTLMDYQKRALIQTMFYFNIINVKYYYSTNVQLHM